MQRVNTTTGSVDSGDHVEESDADDGEPNNEATLTQCLLPGNRPGFIVSKVYAPIPVKGFLDHPLFHKLLEECSSEKDRLKLKHDDVTLPVALMLIDNTEYQTMSSAKRACRKGHIIVQKGPVDVVNNESAFVSAERGYAWHRIKPNDVIAKQARVEGGFYPSLDQLKQPIDIMVVHDDDHFAIVNKQAGTVVDSRRKMNGTNLRSVLPYFLNAPKHGTLQILTRPNTCHRLDKETSGLLIVAKTKPAHMDLLQQFRNRTIKKTYCALVHGRPSQPEETRLGSDQMEGLAVRAAGKSGEGDEQTRKSRWQLIDHALQDKSVAQSAVTVWRLLKEIPCAEAKQGTLSLVEMKPQTGRHHQLRRHMAWVKGTPIVGDKKYDHTEKRLMDDGLFLCSNRVTLEHPYFNSDSGRREFINSMSSNLDKQMKDVISENEKTRIFYDKDCDKVLVEATIVLPEKFSKFSDN